MTNKQKPANEKIIVEFGGPIGAFFIIIFSHCLMLYLWLSLQYYRGGIFFPNDLNLLFQQLTAAIPNKQTIVVYWSFMFIQIIFAMIMPGPIIKGLPVATENNQQHKYLCNGVFSWYATLLLTGILHYTEIFRINFLVDNLGKMMVTAMISGDIISLIIYYWGIISGKQIRMYGNFFYDFFMGSFLNPRIGNVCLKMFAQIRVSWMQLFLLTLSAAVKQQQELGYVSNSMIVMLVAHFLYTNACQKGQQCIPTTWDIFYEKFGWMLIFWNLAGVPYVYCFQSFYLLKNPQVSNSEIVTVILITVLLIAYYIWDTSQSQKNRFRMKLRGTFIKRNSFPQLPWGTLQNPKYLKTECGSTLLIDGWWKYARKIHYTCDIVMGSVWALSCGFSGILPFYYPAFFTGMIIHRYFRDNERCKRKYGKDWDKYCSIVKYAFIPGIV